MGLTSFGFLVVMVLIGGIVALLADNLGRKIGKKRLKLHSKLRPRHTATLFVVGSGLIIPLVTVFLVAALSKDVRVWLTEGEKAIQDLPVLRAEREKLTNDISGLNSQIGTLSSQRDAESKRALSAESQRTKLENEAKILSANVKSLSNRSNEIADKLGQAQRNLIAAQKSYQESSIGLKRDRSKVQAAYNELNRQTREAFEYQRTLLNDIAKNERTIQDQLKLIDSADKERRGLESQIESLKSTYATDLAIKEAELIRIQKLLDDGARELKQIQDDTFALKQMSGASRQRLMIYALGNEVARLVVPSDMSSSQARNVLNSLMRSARVSAEANGAKGTPRVPAAAIFDQQIDGRNVTAEELTSQIVARIAGVPESRILIAQAFWNSFAGEPVPLTVTAFPNKLCFPEGSVVSEGRIDGGKSSGEILRNLQNWLGGEVKAAALKAGMIPVVGQENSFATISPDQVFDLVQQVMATSRTVRVQAIAFEDTYSSGPLKLLFRIR